MLTVIQLGLNLEGNEIMADGASALARGLKKNKGLTNLSISNNSIGDRGAVRLAIALRDHPSLTRIDLSGCEISHKGVESIATNLLGTVSGIEEIDDDQFSISGVSGPPNLPYAYDLLIVL